MKMKMNKTISVITLLLVLLVTSVPAMAEERTEPSGVGILFDVVLIRPLGIASIVLGAGVFVISLPFSLPTNSTGVAARKLVAEPFKFTFARPVGEIHGY